MLPQSISYRSSKPSPSSSVSSVRFVGVSGRQRVLFDASSSPVSMESGNPSLSVSVSAHSSKSKSSVSSSVPSLSPSESRYVLAELCSRSESAVMSHRSSPS